MRTKKSILFHAEAKTKNKTDKNEFCVNSLLLSKHFNFETKNYAIKNFSALKTINLLFNIILYGFEHQKIWLFVYGIVF